MRVKRKIDLRWDNWPGQYVPGQACYLGRWCVAGYKYTGPLGESRNIQLVFLLPGIDKGQTEYHANQREAMAHVERAVRRWVLEALPRRG